MRLAKTLLAIFVSGAAHANPCATGPVLTDRLTEASVDMLTLANDSRRLVPAGITVPEAKGVSLPIPGAAITAFNIASKGDRWGRFSAQIFADGRWLQGTLLEAGLAYNNGTAPLDACNRAMLAAEAKARRAKRGLWAAQDFPLPTDDPVRVAQQTGRFALLTGKVLSIGDRETRFYLNFGKKWSQDVTAVAYRTGRGAFKGSFDRLKALEGRLVLLRGVVEEGGGPLIRIVHDSQIVALD